jgi:histidinol-phosphate phosphatase family protein
MSSRALFVDFGGTLCVLEAGRTAVDDEGNPILKAHVADTIARVRARFHACFIVSNQARIGRGEITRAEVLRRFGWINERLGRPFTDWRLCPHQDADACGCRKPRPGMFVELASAYRIDLSASEHVGDSEKDRAAAVAAGIPTFHWAWDFFRPNLVEA